MKQMILRHLIIREVLANAGADIYERLHVLMQRESFLTYIDTGIIYSQIRNNPAAVYSFLLVAGYLKAVKVNSAFGGDYMCEVALPDQVNRRRCLGWEDLNDGENANEKSDHTDRNSGQRKVSFLSSEMGKGLCTYQS